MTSTVALIPAAGGSKDGLGRISDFPAALAVVSGRPLIAQIIDQLMSLGIIDFRIGIRGKYVEEFRFATINLISKVNILFIEVEKSNSPVETISLIANSIDSFDSVLINLGDTLCKWDHELMVKSDVAIVVDEVSDLDRWSTVTISSDWHVRKIHEQGSIIPKSLGICGIYWWKARQEFKVSLSVQTQDSQILNLLEARTSIMKAIPALSWIDSDREDLLENSRLSVIQSRHFNELNIDSYKGLIRKTSSNVSKLQREIAYYNNLPRELQIFFPRMTDFEVNEINLFQELEFYSYPNLSEVYVFGNAPKFVWGKIFTKLHKIIFESFSGYKSPDRHDSLALKSIFIKKCKDRLKLLLDSPHFLSELLEAETLVINEEKYLGIQATLQLAEEALSSVPEDSTIIHGDLCLSNVICDLVSTNLKLIDPRGGFETSSCYGPQAYDVAKLGHSIIGKYDFIIADHFIVSRNGLDNFSLEIYSLEGHNKIAEQFLDIFADAKFSRELIALLSGLVLLSIPSFHLDVPERAQAMFLQGIVLTNKALRELS